MNETIRCFIAIELPIEIKNQIESYIAELINLAPKLKWVKKEGLHITIKFLGNQSTQKIENMINVLLPLGQTCQPLRLVLKILVHFPINENHG